MTTTVYKVTAEGMEELEASSVTYATVTIHGMRRNRNSMNPETWYMTNLSMAVIYARVLNNKALDLACENVRKLTQSAEEIKEWAAIVEEKNDES